MAERDVSPMETGSDPPSSPSHDGGAAEAATAASAAATSSSAARAKKPKRKKQKRKAAPTEAAAATPSSSSAGAGSSAPAAESAISRKQKKVKKKHKLQEKVEKQQEKEKEKEAKVVVVVADNNNETAAARGAKKPRKKVKSGAVVPTAPEVHSAEQKAVNDQMRRVLDQSQYSAHGSIVDTDSDEEESSIPYRGETVRMDRSALMAAMRKHLWMERLNSGPGNVVTPKPGEEDDDDKDGRRGGRKKKKKGKRGKDDAAVDDDELIVETSRTADAIVSNVGTGSGDVTDEFDDRDGGSIFGQTTGSSNATWVECDKCKKWRRLRGVVDEKKLPSRWYCSMNKNDPERARCSAAEEEYEAASTPESAADARTRKHLRVWVRRLQCNEAYEARQPTLTRGRKRATSSTAKEPYEWIRCCNQSCGKWRAILRCMDSRTSVMDRTVDGEWYCVMNTWDEKMASCAAPQENLPAIGCPAWVNQDEK